MLARLSAPVAAAALVLAVAAAGVAAASGAAPVAQPTTSTAPTTTSAPTTTEAPTSPPTTAAPTTAATTATTATTVVATTAAPAGTGDNGTSVNWGLVALIAAIVVVVIAVIALIAGRARKRSAEQGVLHRRIAQVVGGAQWVHDQASLDLIGGTQSPDRLRVGWDDTRRRMNDMGAEATAIAVDVHDQQLAGELRQLTHALGMLAGALDTNVGLRLSGRTDPGSVAATDESYVTVNERRHDLRAALAPLARRV